MPRLARIELIKKELAKCAKADCPERPLLQARLNDVLKTDKMIRDFEGTAIPAIGGTNRAPGGATAYRSPRAALIAAEKRVPRHRT
jgi:hypothetical protein